MKTVKYFGYFLLFTSLVYILLTYYKVIYYELKYALNKQSLPTTSTILINNKNKEEAKKDVIVPVSNDFSVIIPKLGINTKVIPNVNPYNSNDYNMALSQGVAHANTSGLPGENSNIFLFAHSSESFLLANRYNSIFYLLNKLTKNDEVYLVYKNQVFKYKISNKDEVNAKKTKYLNKDYAKNTLVLMTCWPPGTNLNRLIVEAVLYD